MKTIIIIGAIYVAMLSATDCASGADKVRSSVSDKTRGAVVSCSCEIQGQAVSVRPSSSGGREARLFAAIRKVESNGNDKAVGDGGKSRGPYQCSLAAWLDGTKAIGVSWNYETYVWSRWHSEQVMLGYWKLYGCKTDESKSRCWNGGPNGMRKSATAKYWKRVKQNMKGIK
jgi:hypothetical protein